MAATVGKIESVAAASIAKVFGIAKASIGKVYGIAMPAGGVPFLDGWSYRKSITLSRASGAVNNYQMKLLVGESSGATGEDVDCGGHVAADFDDLRFTTSDGSSLLDYWIESISGASPNGLATVWIEFPTIGTGATTFYMYYGGTETAVSSGANTFIVFDDFERGADGDAVGGDWTVVSGTGKISTAQYWGGSRSLRIDNGRGTIPQTPSADISIMVRWRKPDSANSLIAHTQGTDGFYLIHQSTENLQYYKSAAPAGYVTIGNYAHSTWHLAEVNNFNYTAKTNDFWINGVKAVSGGAMNTVDNYNSVISLTANTGDAYCHYDNIIVRNWRATEPAWGSWGSEESA